MEEVRCCVRIFTGSPKLNDELRRYAEEQEDTRDLKLVLDVESRWNSVLRMLRNFLKLEAALRKVYVCQRMEFPFEAEHITALKEVVNSLEPVETAVKRPSLAESTMRTSDLALQVSV